MGKSKDEVKSTTKEESLTDRLTKVTYELEGYIREIWFRIDKVPFFVLNGNVYFSPVKASPSAEQIAYVQNHRALLS